MAGFQQAPPEPSRGCNGKKPVKRLFGIYDITVRLFIMEGSDMPLFFDSVKLSIKSLKVLDLRIEIPAAATVGLLKVCDTSICDFLFFHFGFMLLPYYV